MEMAHGHHEMKHDKKDYIEDPGAMMAEHPNTMKWVEPALMILGGWLATSPLVFSYQDLGMLWSDVVTGILILGISSFALAFPKYACVPLFC